MCNSIRVIKKQNKCPALSLTSMQMTGLYYVCLAVHLPPACLQVHDLVQVLSVSTHIRLLRWDSQLLNLINPLLQLICTSAWTSRKQGSTRGFKYFSWRAKRLHFILHGDKNSNKLKIVVDWIFFFLIFVYIVICKMCLFRGSFQREHWSGFADGFPWCDSPW